MKSYSSLCTDFNKKERDFSPGEEEMARKHQGIDISLAKMTAVESWGQNRNL